MDSGDIFLIFVVGGAVIGGIMGLIMWLVKAQKIRSYYKVSKGMTYEQIIAALGEPNSKTQKGDKLICLWKFTFNGKPSGARAVFINNVAKSIG